MAGTENASSVGNVSVGNASSVSGCAYFGGAQWKCDTVLGVKRAMACLSCGGCVFVLVSVVLLRRYVAFPQRLILYLGVAALFDSVALVVQGPKRIDTAWCDAQAWGVTYFHWSVLLWVIAITFNLFMLVTRNKRTEKWEWLYHVICWGVPFVVSLLPFTGNHYGPSGLWCWIKDDWAWRFFAWYIPLFVGIVGLFVVYTYITVEVHRKLNAWQGLHNPDTETRIRILQDEITPLRGYPFVYLAVSVFPLINRIQNSISEEPMFELVLLHVLTSPLQGFLNAVVFGLDKDTRSHLKPAQLRMALHTWWYRERSTIQEYKLDITQKVAATRTDSNPLPPDIETGGVLSSQDGKGQDNVGYF
jgi:hypothetical protein